MTLKDWLDQTRTNQTHFSRLIDVDRITVWRWLQGHSVPSSGTIMEIDRATEGAVTLSDWYPERVANDES